MLAWLREKARELKRESWALALAFRDPRTPLLARLVAFCVVAYALSPIDLIPDFIPVLGQLDDLVLVPLGIALAVWLIPPPVMAECRAAADAAAARGIGKAGAIFVVAMWSLCAIILWLWLRGTWQG
jgi:uncharacterized membrane protein YkvA (DUF1232 family)